MDAELDTIDGPPEAGEKTGEEYKGYPVATKLSKKGKTLWYSEKVNNFQGQPLCFETLEQLHSRIDSDIDSQAYAAAVAALDKAQSLLSNEKIIALFLEQLGLSHDLVILSHNGKQYYLKRQKLFTEGVLDLVAVTKLRDGSDFETAFDKAADLFYATG
jgi:hypothetical protein